MLDYRRGRIDDALGLMLESKSIAEEVGDKGQIAKILNNITHIYVTRGDEQKALETLLEASLLLSHWMIKLLFV